MVTVVSPYDLPYCLYKPHALLAKIVRTIPEKWRYKKILCELRQAVDTGVDNPEMLPETYWAISAEITKYGLVPEEYIAKALEFYKEKRSYIDYSQIAKVVTSCENVQSRHWEVGLTVPDALRDPFYRQADDFSTTAVALVPPDMLLSGKSTKEQLSVLYGLIARTLSSCTPEEAILHLHQRQQELYRKLGISVSSKAAKQTPAPNTTDTVHHQTATPLVSNSQPPKLRLVVQR